MITRLQGGFEDESTAGEGYLDKKAMLVYCGKFDSLDGPVEIKDEDIDKLAANHNSLFSKLGQALGLKHYPPIQLDHSTSAKDTVGRLVGNLEVGEHKDAEGKPIKALFGTVRILGADNIEKVKDGRWTHLSIGADLTAHKISELTITPFPAAAEASLLAKTNLADQQIVKRGTFEGFKYIIYRGKPGQFWAEGVGKVANAIERSTIFKTAEQAEEHAEMEIEGYLMDQDERSKMSSKRLADGTVSKDHRGYKVIAIQEKDKWHVRVTKEGHDYDLKNEYDNAQSAIEEGMKAVDQGQVKFTQGEEPMDYKSMKEKMAMYEKCKKHMTGHKGLSEEDAEKELSALDDEKLTAMSAEADEHEKKMADEVAKKKEEESKQMAALKSSKEGLIKLANNFKATTKKVQLESKKAKILSRLSALKSEAKLTPAEVKKINLDELAAKDDATIDTVLKTYENREPQVSVGLYGTTKALTGAQLSAALKKVNMSRMELETRLNMPSKRDEALKQLKQLEEAEKEVNVHIDALPGGEHIAGLSEYDEMWGKMKKMMDEGKHDDAKGHMLEYMKKVMSKAQMSDAHVDGEGEKHMSALAEDVKKLQTEFGEFLKQTAPHFGVTEAELV